MASGILGNFDLLENIPQSIYVASTDDNTSVTLNVVNRRTDYAKVSVVITDSQNSITDTDGWIEIDAEIPPKGVMERTGIIVPTGKYLTLKSDNKFVNAVAWGIEVGNLSDPQPEIIPTSATNLLIDGDFSQGNFTYWPTGLSLSGFASIIDGKAVLQDFLSSSSFSQSFPVKGGELYRYKFTVSESSGTTVRVNLFQVPAAASMLIPITGPGTYEGEFVALGNTTELVWFVEIDQGRVVIDNCEFWNAADFIPESNQARLQSEVFELKDADDENPGRRIAANSTMIAVQCQDSTISDTSGDFDINFYDKKTGARLPFWIERPDTTNGFRLGDMNDNYVCAVRADTGADGTVYIYDISSFTTGNQTADATSVNPNPYGTDAIDSYATQGARLLTNDRIVTSDHRSGTAALPTDTFIGYTSVVEANGATSSILDAPDAVSGTQELFGYAFDTYGTAAVIGAYGNITDDGSAWTGRAYAWDFEGAEFTGLKTMTFPELGQGITRPSFGSSVAIGPVHCLVTAQQTAVSSGSETYNKVFVFEKITGNYISTIEPPQTGYTHFGKWMDIEDDLALITDDNWVYLYQIGTSNTLLKRFALSSTAGSVGTFAQVHIDKFTDSDGGTTYNIIIADVNASEDFVKHYKYRK